MEGALSEVPIDGDVAISNALAVRRCAIAGVGPALLPNWLIDDDVTEKRLLDLFPNYRVAAISFDTAAWLLYPSRAFLPQKVRVAIDFLRPRIRMRRRMEAGVSKS
jgi:DNA-binding transcriptional LysR family regulator